MTLGDDGEYAREMLVMRVVSFLWRNYSQLLHTQLVMCERNKSNRNFKPTEYLSVALFDTSRVGG